MMASPSYPLHHLGTGDVSTHSRTGAGYSASLRGWRPGRRDQRARRGDRFRDRDSRSRAASTSRARTAPGTSRSRRRRPAPPSSTASSARTTRGRSRCTPRSRPTRSSLTLPPGKYTITVERGKEYLPETRVVTVGKEPVELRFKLRRWIDMAARGWYSGETHVHRSAEELPTLVLAEDLNVAFPLSYWVTEAFASPKTARKGPFQGDRPEAHRGRPDARHLPAQHRVRDLHRRQEAAHARGVLRPQPPDRPRRGRAAGEGDRRARPQGRRADRTRQAQLAVVDGDRADREGRSLRAGQQPRLADGVRLRRASASRPPST